MRIGLIGTALVGNTNLGCVALTYSLVKLLNDINQDYKLIVFDWKTSDEAVSEMCKQLKISEKNIENHRMARLDSKHIVKRISFLNALKNCDVVINLTEGDSFTDIYGDERFNIWASILGYCESKNIPVILGPQTYGPFNNQKNIDTAKRIINSAHGVFTRDEKSQDFIYEIANRTAMLTTDLAFSLPYVQDIISSKKLKIGINISGLLWFENGEKTKKDFQLAVNYQEVIYQIIDQLLTDEKYEIHLIPHVIRSDERSHKEIITKYPQIVEAPDFGTPIEAKNYISAMDVFIGSRMHATIASYSSGVPTIPLSYSRKFEGLFGALGYNHSLSLLNMDQQEIIELVLKKVELRELLKQEIEASVPLVEEKKSYLKSAIETSINGLN